MYNNNNNQISQGYLHWRSQNHNQKLQIVSFRQQETICNNEHINYAMKLGKNCIVEYSAAAYELEKTVTAQILQSNDFKENVAIVEQVGQDQTNAIVDLVYKIYNRKQNGQTGIQLKFAINMYHTQCKMNVNGNRVDIFVNDIFDKICEKN